jgi:crossover junction endodeoxyribonuclease RuvC
MRLLGIDPGLRLTGYACVEMPRPKGAANTWADPTLVEAGVIRLKPADSMAVRLAQLHADLEEILDDLKPQTLAVEQLFTHYAHVRTGILMGHARGVVLLAAGRRGLDLVELLPTAVKKAVTGRGHATKRQVQYAVMGQLGLKAPPSPPDVADAIAIALTAARRLA